MTHHEALKNAYQILSPYSDKQKWEFDSNIFHLSSIATRVAAGSSIVDLGCGIGILALALKLLGYDVTGIDKYVFTASNSYAVNDIEQLKAIWASHGLQINSGDAIHDHNSKLFDVAISVAVIEHQSDLKNFMDGTLRYVKPGGQIYIATPNAVNFLNRFRVLCGKAPMSNMREFYASSNFVGHWREYTVAELKTIAEMSGLTSIEAGNAQTLKPRFGKNWRIWHRTVAQIGALMIPNSGDTNFLWAHKK